MTEAINKITGSSFLKTVDRMTFVIKLHHQRNGEDADSFETSGWFFCDEKEQKYHRKMKLKKSQGHTKLDLGWLDAGYAGVVIIENVTGKANAVNLTEEELNQQKNSFLSVFVGNCLDPAKFIVRPGKIPFMGETIPGTSITLFAENGDVDVSVTVFPR